MSARSLAGLACASRDEDRTGIVRTGDPGLERLVGSLVEALVVLDNLIREKVLHLCSFAASPYLCTK